VNWIVDKARFEDLYLEAKTCVFIDSDRIPTSLKRLSFDDAEIFTPKFADMLQQLLTWSNDSYFSYVVLEPDPKYYFNRLFSAFPAVEVKKGTPAREYIEILNEGPEESPVESLGTSYSVCAIFPPSRRWFVHAMRSDRDNGGHLWVPKDWMDRVISIYPYMSTISGI
jgi:hypothetical protein